jgi:hypothetical protein
MASQDFIELMKKLHDEKYKLHSKAIEYGGMDEHPSLKVTAVLEKDGNQISIQSSEPDFLKYVVELRGVADMAGEPKFASIKDFDKYNADIEHLFDLDKSRVKSAAEEVGAGKFKREYAVAQLVDEFLENPESIKDAKFLPLKDDYHHILVAASIEGKRFLRTQEKLLKKFTGAKKYIDATEQIMNGFKPKSNAIKGYRVYKNYLNFDIDQLMSRVSTQLPVADDTLKDFMRRDGVDADIAIPKMMNIYGRFLELLKPVLNLVRVGLELKRGKLAPDKDYSLARNIEVLKSDQEYGQFFNCLDEQIRHSDAHISLRIDKAVRKIYLMDSRVEKEKIVRVYTFDELMEMISVMQNEFFQATLSTLLVFDIGMLVILLASREYKFLLLALDNC